MLCSIIDSRSIFKESSGQWMMLPILKKIKNIDMDEKN